MDIVRTLIDYQGFSLSRMKSANSAGYDVTWLAFTIETGDNRERAEAIYHQLPSENGTVFLADKNPCVILERSPIKSYEPDAPRHASLLILDPKNPAHVLDRFEPNPNDLSHVYAQFFSLIDKHHMNPAQAKALARAFYVGMDHLREGNVPPHADALLKAFKAGDESAINACRDRVWEDTPHYVQIKRTERVRQREDAQLTTASIYEGVDNIAGKKYDFEKQDWQTLETVAGDGAKTLLIELQKAIQPNEHGVAYFVHGKPFLMRSKDEQNVIHITIFGREGVKGKPADQFSLAPLDYAAAAGVVKNTFERINRLALDNPHAAALFRCLHDGAQSLQPPPMYLLDNPEARNADAQQFCTAVHPLIEALVDNDQNAVEACRETIKSRFSKPAPHGERGIIAFAKRVIDEAETRDRHGPKGGFSTFG